MNGNDLETQRLLNYRGGVYSGLNGKIYLDFNKIKTPSLVEHETIHFLGNIRCWGLNYPKRIINHHSIAANIVVTLLDKEDYLGRHKLGEASIKEFKKLKWYKLLPIEFQEGIKDFSNTCFKIGNYARESGEGYNLLYKLSK